MLISYTDALNIVLGESTNIQTEKIELSESIDRTLAEDVVSGVNIPPFNKAAMDGFAITKNDIGNELTILETLAAGQTPSKKVKTGLAIKIMTGAPVPEGTDLIVPVEQATETNNKVRFSNSSKSNIIPKAEDVSIGDVVLKKGVKIDARHIAVMASVGCVNPWVYKKPLIGILSTGSELVEPNQEPNISQIRNSNGLQLLAQVLQCNAQPKYFGLVKDTYNDTLTAIKQALTACDILLISGGVSMGQFDFVPSILEELGVDIKFKNLAVQPGKPTTFGIKNKKIVFGLPGNPVSAFFQFSTLVKPLINKHLGLPAIPKILKLPLGESYKRKKAERLSFLPVTISNNSEVFLIHYHGSAHIHALPNANAIAEIPAGVKELQKGDFIHVRLF